MSCQMMTVFLVFFFSLITIQRVACAAEATTQGPDNIADFYVFGVGLGLGVGGAISWKYKETYTGKFTTLQEGWFGSDTYAGGADKLGHFYTDYLLVRVIYDIYSKHGYDGDAAIMRSVIASTTIRSIMEVADGYTSFKFSPEDLVANLAGSLTSGLLLQHPTIDEAFGMSWTYLPSQEKLDGKVDWFSIDNDYNGSIYHLDARLKGVRRLFNLGNNNCLDPYTLSLSYATRGYDRARDYKQRILGLTLGLNAAEFVERSINSDSIWRPSAAVLKYFKLPFSFGGLTYDLDHHRLGFRFGLNYFY